MQAKNSIKMSKALMVSVAVAAIALLILQIITMVGMYNVENKPAEVIRVEVPATDSALVQEIHEELFKDEKVETVAENTALAELDTKEVMKMIANALEDEGVDIESYKHLTDVVVKDVDTEVDGEKAEVVVEVKAYYYVDGDKDEEGRARLELTFKVKELVEDDDYEDAEVSKTSVEVVKIYD